MKIIITNNSSKSTLSKTDFDINFKVKENENLSIETIQCINQALHLAFSQSFE